MSRYRKVEVRIYSDEKFRQLSPIAPCAQGLWLYLITGPHTTLLPGLIRAGRAGMAEELGWPQEAFDRAFEEIVAQGMVRADFENRVIWIPNAIKHNPPASPNVVTSWAGQLENIPECTLKSEASVVIADALRKLNPKFIAAFEAYVKPSGDPSAKASLKPSPNAMPNQEQETEAAEEERKGIAEEPPTLELSSELPRIAAPPSKHERFKAITEAYWRSQHRPPSDIAMTWDKTEGKAMRELLAANPNLTDTQFAQCLHNRVHSDSVNHSERPATWLRKLTNYASGPLDIYNKRKSPGSSSNGNHTNRSEQRTADNRRAAEQALREMADDSASGACGDAPDDGKCLDAQAVRPGPIAVPAIAHSRGSSAVRA